MPVATVTAVRKQIEEGQPGAVYVLLGEDEIEKSVLAHQFEDLIDQDLRAFNVDRLHAGDWTTGDRLLSGVGSMIAAAKTIPMLAPRRLILVLQADTILAPKRESEAAAQALEHLESFIKKPEPQAVLVLVASTLDRRGRTAKLLVKEATLVECGVIADVDDAQRWIRNRVAAAGAQIDARAAMLLARLGGTDVQRLRNDVDRLLLYALGQKTIAEDDVREIAGPAALQDEWAMANAIEAGNTAEALRQLALMLDAGARPEIVTGQLGWVVRSKMPGGPARVPAAIDAVFRTDVALKSSGGDHRILLERLVVELCDAGKGARRARG